MCRRFGDVEAGQYVVLCVTDTGTGMPKEILDQVFEPFFTTKAYRRGLRPRARHGAWLRQAVRRPCAHL